MSSSRSLKKKSHMVHMITMGRKRIMKHLFLDSPILYVELNFTLTNYLKEKEKKNRKKKRQLMEMTGLFVLFDIRGKPFEMTGLY